MIPVLSILPQNASMTATVVATALQLLMVLWVIRVKQSPHKLSRQSIIVALFLCLLYYLFCMYPGDYYRYKDTVETIGHVSATEYDALRYHLEIPYFTIINLVHNDYLLFRLVVWGGALLLFYLTSLRLELNKSTFVFYLSIFIVPFTSTSRLALALSTCFYGYSLIIKPFPKKKILSIILGILFCYLGIKLHRSAPFLLLVLPLSLLKANKVGLFVLLGSIPIIVLLVGSGLFELIFDMSTTVEDSLFDAYTAQQYLQDERRVRGIGELIRLFLSYASYALILFLIIKTILNNKYNSLPIYIQKVCNSCFLIIIFSVVVLLLPGANSYKTFERLMVFSIVPSSFVLSYFLQNKIEIKLTSLTTTFILGWTMYGLLYALYLGES